MDREYTLRIDGVEVVVQVQQVKHAIWRATALFEGTRYEASAETAEEAVDALSRMLPDSSIAKGGPEPPQSKP